MTRHQLLENIADKVEEINRLRCRGVKNLNGEVEELYKASVRLQNWDLRPLKRKPISQSI
jgi:hypothetical protein